MNRKSHISSEGLCREYQHSVPNCSRGKPLCRACARLGRLFFAVPRGRVCHKGVQKVSGSGRYLVNGHKKCSLVGLRWFVEAAYFPHELQCSPVNLFVRHGRFEVEEGLDVSTHIHYLHTSGLADVPQDSLPGSFRLSSEPISSQDRIMVVLPDRSCHLYFYQYPDP
jgi:hypothetical protein